MGWRARTGAEGEEAENEARTDEAESRSRRSTEEDLCGLLVLFS